MMMMVMAKGGEDRGGVEWMSENKFIMIRNKKKRNGGNGKVVMLSKT